MLETNMKKLFESNRQLNSAVALDAKIAFHDALYIQYEQFWLDDNYRQYLETTIVSEKLLRMGIQKAVLQNSYEMPDGAQNFTVELRVANRQFDWPEISMAFDKSNKHSTFTKVIMPKELLIL